jgi:hypothetical protein
MNRRRFFSFLGIGAAATVVTPKSLASQYDRLKLVQVPTKPINCAEVFEKLDNCKHPHRHCTRVPLMTTTVIWEDCSSCGRLLSRREVGKTKEDSTNHYPRIISRNWQ